MLVRSCRHGRHQTDAGSLVVLGDLALLCIQAESANPRDRLL